MLWRVELDPSGREVSCRRADTQASTHGGEVFYVTAENAVDAFRAAQKKQVNAYHRQKRAERKEAGLCAKCGGPMPAEKRLASSNGLPVNRCATCRDRGRYDAQLKLRRSREAERPKPKDIPTGSAFNGITPPLPHAERVRLALLEEVHKAWINAPNVGGFSRWLNAEIEKLQPRTIRRVS